MEVQIPVVFCMKYISPLYLLHYLMIYDNRIQAGAANRDHGSPEYEEDSKFVINPDRSSDKFPQCHVFWDLVKFPSVILTIGILESLESLSLSRQMIVSLCAGIGGIVRRIL